MKSQRKCGTHCLLGNEMNHTNFTKLFCKHWAVAATNSLCHEVFFTKGKKDRSHFKFHQERRAFPNMSYMRHQNKRTFDKNNGSGFKKICIGEGSQCEELEETEMGALMELTLIFSEFLVCGKYRYFL